MLAIVKNDIVNYYYATGYITEYPFKKQSFTYKEYINWNMS